MFAIDPQLLAEGAILFLRSRIAFHSPSDASRKMLASDTAVVQVAQPDSFDVTSFSDVDDSMSGSDGISNRQDTMFSDVEEEDPAEIERRAAEVSRCKHELKQAMNVAEEARTALSLLRDEVKELDKEFDAAKHALVVAQEQQLEATTRLSQLIAQYKAWKGEQANIDPKAYRQVKKDGKDAEEQVARINREVESLNTIAQEKRHARDEKLAAIMELEKKVVAAEETVTVTKKMLDEFGEEYPDSGQDGSATTNGKYQHHLEFNRTMLIYKNALLTRRPVVDSTVKPPAPVKRKRAASHNSDDSDGTCQNSVVHRTDSKVVMKMISL